MMCVQLVFVELCIVVSLSPGLSLSHHPVSPDWEGVVKLSEDFNGADLRNVCTEAGTSCFISLNL